MPQDYRFNRQPMIAPNQQQLYQFLQQRLMQQQAARQMAAQAVMGNPAALQQRQMPTPPRQPSMAQQRWPTPPGYQAPNPVMGRPTMIPSYRQPMR